VLKKHSLYDFSDYSDNSIFRRIQKVMRDHQISLEELAEKTQVDKYFVEEVVEAITVNTTELFRDPNVWKHLFEKYLSAYKGNSFINVWHAGCSTGQEVYSLLILFSELGMLDKVRVFATDISQKALDIAKKGVYQHQIDRGCLDNFNTVFENHPDNSLAFSKYFDVNEKNDKISVKPFLQEHIKFIRHDLVKNEMPFYNNVDVVFCRNVLIYFNLKLQNRIVQRFYDGLYNNGILVLGAHEGLSGFFKTKFDRQGPLYRKSNVFHLRY
jgi:chemotaxis protein methyltransferase CheR